MSGRLVRLRLSRRCVLCSPYSNAMNRNQNPSAGPGQAIDGGAAAASAAVDAVGATYDHETFGQGPAADGAATGLPVESASVTLEPGRIDPARGAAICSRLIRLADSVCVRVFMAQGVGVVGDGEFTARLAAEHALTDQEREQLGEDLQAAMEFWGMQGAIRPDVLLGIGLASWGLNWALAFADLKRRRGEAQALAAKAGVAK